MSEDENVQDQDANDQVDETTEQTTEVTTETVAEETTAPDTVETKADEHAPVERPAWSMPVAKAQEEKRRAVEKAKEEAKAESDTEIKRIREEYEQKTVQRAPAEADAIQRYAEEHGLDPEAARGLVDIVSKSIAPNLSKYDKLIEQQEISAHKQKVSDEINAKVLPLIQRDYPNATPQHIAEVKARIEELAFSEGFNQYRLEDIYRVKQDEFAFKNGYSAEPSGGRSSEIVDFSKMTDAEEHALSDSNPAQYEKYLKEMSKKDSRYID